MGPLKDLKVIDLTSMVSGPVAAAMLADQGAQVIKVEPLHGEQMRFLGAPVNDLLEVLKRPEYRYRYWAKRELREREKGEVKQALDRWVANLDASDARFRHHQVEAIWMYRTIGAVNAPLLEDVLNCEVP